MFGHKSDLILNYYSEKKMQTPFFQSILSLVSSQQAIVSSKNILN